MIIDGKRLAATILKQLQKDIQEGVQLGWPKPELLIFTVKPTEEVKAYMRNKQRRMEEIGGTTKIIQFRKSPRFEEFVKVIGEYANHERTSGVIIQLPLPASLGTVTLLEYIPAGKEVEGLKKKSPYQPPIGLAVLTMLKAACMPLNCDDPAQVVVDIDRDSTLIKGICKRKKVVVLGRGATGGQPVGHILSAAHITYININSTTPHPEDFISQADIVISAVGKTVIEPDHIKRGAVLISVGLHKTASEWVGDYRDKDIEDIASAYSPTPGGVGPLNVAYLLYNTVQAWKMQNMSATSPEQKAS